MLRLPRMLRTGRASPWPALSAAPRGAIRTTTACAARSNYVGSFGDFWLPVGSLWGPTDFAGNGVFGSNVSFRLKDITDGASTTFAIGERSSAAFASIWAGTDGWNRCEREGLAMVMATAHYPMNSARTFQHELRSQGAAAFGSMHPHGLQFLMVDGSVRSVSDTIGFANDPDLTQLGVFQRWLGATMASRSAIFSAALRRPNVAEYHAT